MENQLITQIMLKYLKYVVKTLFFIRQLYILMKNSSLFNIRLFGIEKQKSVFKTIYIGRGPKFVAKC